MQNYHDLLSELLNEGTLCEDRTGVGTYNLFGRQLRYDLSKGLPLVTTKKIHIKSVVHELLWFLSGSTNIRYLQENGVRIWNEWADENGDLGPVYGKQWRDWVAGEKRIDQISEVMETLRKTPSSRRAVVVAWNPGDIGSMALPPCHCLFQFFIMNNKLNCQLYQRSADVFLGVPFNIASYSILTAMVAHQLGVSLGDFVWSGGVVHLYSNHVEQAKEQIGRDIRPLPDLKFNKKPLDIFSYKFEDIDISGYDPHPAIKAKVAV